MERSDKNTTVYTIGHSTREIEDFIRILQAHGIKTLIDIRAFPASRRLPHFNREALQASLAASGIEYLWMPDLGGRRGKILEQSPNLGLRNASFRNYADYMLTPQFAAAAAEVVRLAENQRAAIMCAELVFFQCHRMLISDYLALHGHEVLHIETEKPPRPHRVTAEARMQDGKVVYRGLFAQ